MKFDIRGIKDKITEVFSSDGLTIDSYTVKCESPLTTHTYVDDENVQVIFAGKKPVISVRKFITISVELEEIWLHNTGGKIKLKNFPDINFDLDDNKEMICGSCTPSDELPIRQMGLYHDIDEKFGDKQSRRLAQRALQYAQAWSAMTLDGGANFATLSAKDARIMKAECRRFVMEQFKQDRHGSIVVVLLINWILPYIIKWVVERVIDNLING